MRQGFKPLAGKDAKDLVLDPGRIAKRADEIENRPGPELGTHFCGMTHCGMMALRGHKANARLLDASFDASGRKVRSDT
jgi:hypothetical protein